MPQLRWHTGKISGPGATASTSDISLDAFPAGEPVLIRGFGLTFVDAMVLLTEGRGGRFRREPSGELRYLPSGRELTLYVGSRRGVPYRSRFAYVLPGPPPRIPRYFSPADFTDRSLDFASDLWPALARELTVAGYRELATRWPGRHSTHSTHSTHSPRREASCRQTSPPSPAPPAHGTDRYPS